MFTFNNFYNKYHITSYTTETGKIGFLLVTDTNLSLGRGGGVYFFRVTSVMGMVSHGTPCQVAIQLRAIFQLRPAIDRHKHSNLQTPRSLGSNLIFT
jgi:hypothetical protein